MNIPKRYKSRLKRSLDTLNDLISELSVWNKDVKQ